MAAESEARRHRRGLWGWVLMHLALMVQIAGFLLLSGMVWSGALYYEWARTWDFRSAYWLVWYTILLLAAAQWTSWAATRLIGWRIGLDQYRFDVLAMLPRYVLAWHRQRFRGHPGAWALFLVAYASGLAFTIGLIACALRCAAS